MAGGEKLDALLEALRGMESVLLAYSGGVDSAFLLKAVQISGVRCLAVTSSTDTVPFDDLTEAVSLASSCAISHRIIRTDEMSNEDFLKNTERRCFYCKDDLFGKLKAVAIIEGYNFVIDGSNADDTKDHRPGLEAARLHGVRSPLIEVGLAKSEIREISKALGLPTWDKPSSPCLGSRFPYGMRITQDGLRKVSQAERFLRGLGFRELRVRHFGDTARIEIAEGEIGRTLDSELRKHIVGELKAIGYTFVSLDLEGFRSGKMNCAATGHADTPGGGQQISQ